MTESSKRKSFAQMLSERDIKLARGETRTLQINVGFLCNQYCRHCHLDAGPGRRENMGGETMEAVVAYARRCGFETIDITGGAPELNPHIRDLIERLSPLASRMMFRCNLSALHEKRELAELLKQHRVVIVASLPSLNESQTDSQRGKGIFAKTMDMLRHLNAMGYGHANSGLELCLVSNPTGAFLPPSQAQTEKRFRQILEKKWGIVFNSLFNFANVPLGRFREWLVASGNLEAYMDRLVSAFNPCSVGGLMCRTLVSVSWDGHLYDCDFNLAKGLFMGGRKTHVSEMPDPPQAGTPIAVDEHCHTCTAGAGFT